MKQIRRSPAQSWLNRTVLGIALASLFSDWSHEIATAVLPAFLGSLGVAAAWLGIIEGISDGLSSFAKLGSGFYTDGLPRRKPIALTGYLITAFANEHYTDAQGQEQKVTTFVNLEVWGKPAENFGKLVKKGQEVYVDGKLRMDEWTDKQTNARRTRLYLLGRKLAIHPVQAPGGKHSRGSHSRSPLSSGRRHEKGQEGNQVIP